MCNQFVPFLHFKMEGLSQLKHLAQEEDCICKVDLKDPYFSVPLDQNPEVVRKVSIKRGSLRAHVPVFWARLRTTCVYKVNRSSNRIPEQNQHQSENIFWRYVHFESHKTRSSHESWHGHISPAEFRLYHKYKEISFAHMTVNRIFWEWR